MKYLIGIAIAGLVALWNAPNAYAATCNNVEIHIHHDASFTYDLKFVDFDYGHFWDNYWYEEDFVADEVLEPGDDYLLDRDLEQVEGESIMIRAQLRYKTSLMSGWSDTFNAMSGFETCEDDQHYDIYVTYVY
jgi:hypothetical protein